MARALSIPAPSRQSIVDAVQHAPVNPGGMTLADLADYRAVERAPVCGAYRGNKICSMGPPSSGGVAILQILRDAGTLPRRAICSRDTLSYAHLFTQANRLAFADRTNISAIPVSCACPVEGC